MIDQGLGDKLVAMAEDDLALRTTLAADGSLFQGYHPQMRALHEDHADRLAAIIDEHGWPDADLCGSDGAAAAWLVVQHAISRPALMRRVRDLARDTALLLPAQWAMLDDRIAVFEGRSQLYGTQFDWDADGVVNPLPLAEAAGVDARRAAVGLPPLADALARHRAEAGDPPADLAARQAEASAFARSVGWISGPA